MTTDERVLRLENAFATLSDLAAKADQRLNVGEQRLEVAEQRLDMLTQLAINFDARLDRTSGYVSNLDEKMSALADAQIRADERVSNLDEKMSALADAQIRADDAMANLTAKMSELAAAQAHTDQRLDALINIINEGRNGKP